MTRAAPVPVALPTADAGVPIHDLLIVGAGISGIGMAVHAQEKLPGKSIAIVEARHDLGGTWDLFRYPGIRSDSDMHTLGYIFEPWRDEKAIADGPSIMRYLRRIVADRGIEPMIRFQHKVIAAHWSSHQALWTLDIQQADGRMIQMAARFLYLGAGYYDYDSGYDPVFACRDDFAGQIVHPQFWPDNLDYRGKKIVIIGSGATAVTLVPNMAKDAAHVTMLQRTPTWYITRPAEDRFANWLRRVLPAETAYRITRFKNVRMQDMLFRRARAKPKQVGDYLLQGVRKTLGDGMNMTDYTPPYGPWEQRLCLVPDSDMFCAIRDGKASVVTDKIDRFTKTGIQLQSGKHIDADIIVTATGLKLAVAGKIAIDVDGKPVHWPDHYYYKGCMFSDVPNLALVFGYLNASWTLKADLVSAYVCRVIQHLDASGNDTATPRTDPAMQPADRLFDFSSGYVERALDILPRQGAAAAWMLSQNYLADRRVFLLDPVADGALTFTASHDARAATDASPRATEPA